MCRVILTVSLLLLSMCSSRVFAQQSPPLADWSHGTTMNGFVGVTSDSSHSGAVLGGAAGWELTPGIAIEGSGGWTDFGQGTTSFAGALKARVRLFGRRQIDPFVAGGVGLYRASFGVDEKDVPAFYRRRLNTASTSVGERTFTDPSLLAGGGVSVFVNRHLAIRPDVEAAFVIRDGHNHLVTTVAVHLVYHFENHPVTRARR
jgi:hypothetical protein